MVLLGGHIVNELTTLTRLLVFSSRVPTDSVERSYSGIQYLTLVRLLIGKVAEGLEVFQQRVLSKPLGRTYLPEIEKSREGKDCVASLRRFVGGSSLLRRLRNSHTFHNPSDADLLRAFNALEENEDWSMLAGEPRHTLAFPMSYATTTWALMNETGIADPREATVKIRDEVLDASDALVTFFEYFTIAVAERHRLFVTNLAPVTDTSLLPVASQVSIPPLCFAGPPAMRTAKRRKARP
jgi:hypothetical protein